jgi:hypothetical protein
MKTQKRDNALAVWLPMYGTNESLHDYKGEKSN